jgi:chorismate mutase
MGLGYFIISAIAIAALSVWGVPHPEADPSSPSMPPVNAAAQRLQTADPEAASKFLTGGRVDDPQREQQVIDTVSADASAQRSDAAYVHDVFRNQIDAMDSLEHSRFAQGKIDPAVAPTAAPDLSASRFDIDQLNHTMVSEIAKQRATLHSSSCRAQLDQAVHAVVTARTLDPLYQPALRYATQPYCR